MFDILWFMLSLCSTFVTFLYCWQFLSHGQFSDPAIKHANEKFGSSSVDYVAIMSCRFVRSLYCCKF